MVGGRGGGKRKEEGGRKIEEVRGGREGGRRWETGMSQGKGL